MDSFESFFDGYNEDVAESCVKSSSFLSSGEIEGLGRSSCGTRDEAGGDNLGALVGRCTGRNCN